METITEYSTGLALPAPTSTLARKPQVIIQPELLKDPLFIAGLLLVGISAALFCVPLVSTFRTQSFMGFFFFHYLMSGGYLLVLLFRKLWSWRKVSIGSSLRYLLPLTVLFLISAYALNRDVVVFNPSVHWLSAMLVLQCGTLLALAFAKQLPRLLLLCLVFILGLGLPLFVYLSLYVAPLYLLSTIGVLFLGISLHSYVPLLFVLVSLALVRRCNRINGQVRLTFLAGALLALAIAAYYSVQWATVNRAINREYTQNLLHQQELPAWVRISQKLTRGLMSELALKGSLVYHVFSPTDNFFWGFPNGSFWEDKKHDPLLVVATFFSKPTELSTDERVKILKSLFDGRHHAEERLWSGQNLSTTQVITNVKLWPEYRMAYTEKILSIRNSSSRTTWLQTEEALYTFHLPEGSAISSLSLWIDNVEQKGYLTSKQVADSAYTTIVGREARDPSLVHWKEGNTVTVRVFPVTPAENRRFKIGITSPLALENNQLVYRNIYFDGPISAEADHTVQIDKGLANEVSVPFTTETTPDGKLTYEGSYKPDWQISTAVVPLATQLFSFQDKTYQLEEYKQQLQPAAFHTLYLDLHAAWSKAEIQQVLELAKHRKVYAWVGTKMLKLDRDNLPQIQEQAAELHYSLFPLYLVKDPKKSLLITKGTLNTPNLSDLEGSPFFTKLIASNQQQQPMRAFCLDSEELSPYLKTLREFRMVQLVQGKQAQLQSLLQRNEFPMRAETENQLQIEPAGMLVTELAGATANSHAPDHLYRLFAYNYILSKAGPQSISKDYTDPSLVRMAQKANIVSPLSSLIVLETQKDYDRFGIEDLEGSLGNASMNSSGAVPEPHEWALIIVVALMAVYFLYRHRISQLWIR